MELTLEQNIAGELAEDVERDVFDELKRTGFNHSSYTNVMYILPAEVKFGGQAGYAYLNGSLSVIRNEYASFPYILMHEIGHNFGHHHSGRDTSEYGDQTGMMGIQVFENDAPRACFNAAKSWYFGWYSDRHVEITPTSESTVLNMLSIDDYLNGQVTSDEQYTVARIVEAHEEDLFVMYNRAEGVNSGVLANRDQVAIVKQKDHMKQSILEVGLGLDDDIPSRWTAIKDVGPCFQAVNPTGVQGTLMRMVT